MLPVNDRLGTRSYKDSIALHQLCHGNKLTLTKCRRSDDILFNMLLPENIHKITKATFENEFTDRHISFTTATRIKVNHRMMQQVVKQKKKKPLRLEKLFYDKNSQNVELLPGMPIIARVNEKKLDIFNNELFTIKTIKQEDIIIYDEEKEITIPIKSFQRLFNIAYCITVYKSQGSTFDHSYTIHEFDRFDERLKYVALSRSSNIKHINIV